MCVDTYEDNRRVKNIKNLTDIKLLTGSVYLAIVIV